MKISEFHWRNKQKMKNFRITFVKHENHENLTIEKENNENH